MGYIGSVWVSCPEVSETCFEAAVIANPARTVPATLLLGADFMADRKLTIDFPARTVQLEGKVLPLQNIMKISFRKWPVAGSVRVSESLATTAKMIQAASKEKIAKHRADVRSLRKVQLVSEVLRKRGRRGRSNWWWVTVAGGDPVNVRNVSKPDPDEQLRLTQSDMSRLQKLDRKFGKLARQAVSSFAVLMGDQEVLGCDTQSLLAAWHKEYHKFRPLSRLSTTLERRELFNELNEFTRVMFERYMNKGLKELSFFWSYLIDQCKKFFIKNKILTEPAKPRHVQSVDLNPSSHSSLGPERVNDGDTRAFDNGKMHFASPESVKGAKVEENSNTSGSVDIDPERKQLICEIADQCVKDMVTTDVSQSQHPKANSVQANWRSDLKKL